MHIKGLRQLVQLVPLIKRGDEADEGRMSGVLTIKDLAWDNAKRAYLMPKGTVIVGYAGDGAGIDWTFDLKELFNDLQKVEAKGITLEEAYLCIEAFRTHAGLHVKPEIAQEAIARDIPRAGNIFVKGHNNNVGEFELINRINLMKPMPNGLNFGFNDLKPYDIKDIVSQCWLNRSNENKTITVRLTTDKDVRWDISRVIIRLWVGVPLPF